MQNGKCIIFLVGIIFLTSFVSAQETINQINFSFSHSRRIPFRYINIEIISKPSGCGVHVSSKPGDGEQQWQYSRIDTVYNISLAQFDSLANILKSISSADIYSYNIGYGYDGTDCSIEFGNFQNEVRYKVWSPDYHTTERRLGDFLTACKMILSIGKFDYGKIF